MLIHVECVVETFGTFFLALAVMFSHNPATAAIAIGLMLMSLIAIGGHISGGHYNPAVTLAMWLYYRKIETSEALLYVMCQFIGVGLASFVYQLLTSNLWAAQSSNATTLQSILIEAGLTSVLCSVIITLALPKFVNNHIYPFVIGLTLASIIYIDKFSGGAFNPAIGVAPLIYNFIMGTALDLKHIIIYSVGPLLGAISAYIYTKYFNNGPRAQ